MSLVIETGAGISGANSYANVATVDAYHAARGNAAWTGAEAVKEAAIFRAMNYLDALSWKGIKADRDNPLSWPRVCVRDRDGYQIDTDTVPQGVVNALSEAALREIVSTNSLLPDVARGGQVKRERVDVIETEYAPGAPSGTTYAAIMAQLRGLLKASHVVDVMRG